MQAPPPNSSNNNNNSDVPEPPDGKTITQALEITFRTVWIRLMTSGVGKEYSDAILAFVVAAMAAYKAGYSLNALQLELRTNEKETTEVADPAIAAGRDLALNDNEKQTRLIWITLVYLTMSKTRMVPARPVPSVASELRGSALDDMLSGLVALVDSIFEAEKKGYNLQTFKMELAMQKDTGQSEEITPSQASVRSQWSRIVFTALGALPESLKR